MRRVPELSLMEYIEGSEAQKKSFQDQLFLGLKDYGFIILNDHPIETSMLEQAYQLSEKLFQITYRDQARLH